MAKEANVVKRKLDNPRKWATVAELAAALKVSRQRVHALLKAYDVECVRKGACLFFPRRDYERIRTCPELRKRRSKYGRKLRSPQ